MLSIVIANFLRSIGRLHCKEMIEAYSEQPKNIITYVIPEKKESSVILNVLRLLRY